MNFSLSNKFPQARNQSLHNSDIVQKIGPIVIFFQAFSLSFYAINRYVNFEGFFENMLLFIKNKTN